MPHSLWKHERVLDTLDVTQEGPRDTRPHVSGTLSFMLQHKKSPVFTLLKLRSVWIPLFHWERNPEVAVTPQEKASLTLKLKHIPGSRASIQKDPEFPIHSR